jgi:hypothetical protein
MPRNLWVNKLKVSFKDGVLHQNMLYNEPVQGLMAHGMKSADGIAETP